MPEPFWIHFFAAITLRVDEHHARVFAYGEQLELTDAIRDLNSDRLGNSPFDLLGEDDAQVARWGKVVMVDGAWPAELPTYEPGSFEEVDAREAARRTAWGMHDERERNAALARIKREFGDPATASRNLYVVKEHK